MESLGNFHGKLSKKLDGIASGKHQDKDKEIAYLSQPAPNIVEWVTGTEYWNVPSTFSHWRQYQILRDSFNLRCKNCNSNKPQDVDCWNKSRSYLESEILLTWNNKYRDFVCPKCGTTMQEFVTDEVITPYNDNIIIAGMRSGKSYLGGHIGGYQEHMTTALGMQGGKGYLQKMLEQEKSEWFEITFAASTAQQAQQTIYAKYREMRNNSPWIKRYMKWVKGAEKHQLGSVDKWEYIVNKDAILDGFLQVRYNRIASDSAGVAGKTRIFASIDEWARLSDTEGTRSAQELFRVMNQSLKTIRTAVDINSLPGFGVFGLMLNVTSPIADDDPAMTHLNRAAEGELRRTFHWKGPTWEFNPFMPREAFDEEYEKDSVAAERDFGANPPNAAVPFVDDPIRFWNTIDWNREPIARFRETYLTDPTQEKYIGMELEECQLNTIENYYIFGDAGVSFDSFALVCAHPEWVGVDSVVEDGGGEGPRRIITPTDNSGRIEPNNQDGIWAGDIGTFVKNSPPDMMMNRMMEESQRMNNYQGATAATGNPYDHMGEMMVTVIDFVIRIVPTQTRDIWFESIVDIIRELTKKIRIAAVCFDHWSSDASIQQIRSMNIQSYKVSLKSDNFMSFLRMAYNGRVKMLRPNPEDKVSIGEKGNLIMGTNQEDMYGESIGLVETIKLNRSPDLKRFYNPNKGKVRGRDSDDTARCIIGAHHIVQDSIVDDMANTKKRKSIRKRQQAIDSPMIGGIHKATKPW